MLATSISPTSFVDVTFPGVPIWIAAPGNIWFRVYNNGLTGGKLIHPTTVMVRYQSERSDTPEPATPRGPVYVPPPGRTTA